jgi:magnesium-transporting ATPase (P-type)
LSVDKSVRHGKLVRHLHDEKLRTIAEEEIAFEEAQSPSPAEGGTRKGADGPRALVIEGAALEYLLGDSELEELLFAVANTCDSVIACRVSPAQKAQLVQLVRRYVVPEPVTLAIGDGANDVGMIQEAHVGVGISGKEGQQAVNASDFAIAQFRFLQELTLVHGRWNFMRMTTLALYIFYKNAVMVGCLVAFSGQTLYSGTPLFDQWNIAAYNVVTFAPIAAFGIFDRSLDKDYVKKHPSVYTPTRRNELITKRTLFRWIILVFVHILFIYYFTVWPMGLDGGGATPAFFGLMANEDPERPGDGEVGSLKSVGFVSFTCLIFLMTYKVLYETRSVIIGHWPACTCRDVVGEGCVNRLGYTWIANAYLSVGLYIAAMYLYSNLGRFLVNQTFTPFLGTVQHTFHTSARGWMIILFVPIAAMVPDVAAKLFGNLFYPTQTQIHMEIFARSPRNERSKEAAPVEIMHDDNAV